MKQGLLPIGAVCTLKNRNKTVLIVGLYSPVYDGKVTVYDYKGCSYPEGLTLSNQLYSFNHDDIDKVLYRGYENEYFKVLCGELKGKLTEKVLEQQTTVSNNYFSNIVFDENGYVVKADVNAPEENPFAVPVHEEETNDEEMTVFKNFVFDENGVVISDGSEKPKEAKPKYVFDENGTLISDGSEPLETSSEVETKYVFDENGRVIADGSTPAITPIEDEIELLDDDLEEPDVPDITYQFDENGLVIGEK